MTRKQLILSMQGESNGTYDLMKSCIVSKDIDKLDEWFSAVIDSLFYRVNHKILVLHDNVEDCEYLLYTLGSDTQDTMMARLKIYQSLILNLKEVKSREELFETRRLITTEGFVINDMPGDYPSCEKRLSSFVTTIKNPEKFIGAKRAICISVRSVCLMNFDKGLLWIDIFNKFKKDNHGK